MANHLLVVRRGPTKVKLRRDIIKRLKVLHDACDCEEKSRYIDLGVNSKDDPKWLLIATKWATIEPEDYVLPVDIIEANNVRDALRFYGVDEKHVEALRTPAQLRNELLRFKAFAKSTIQTHIDTTLELQKTFKDKPEHADLFNEMNETMSKYSQVLEKLELN